MQEDAEAAAGAPPTRSHVPLDPPAVFAGAMGLMVLLALLVPTPSVLHGAWRAAGLLPLGCGILLHRSAWRLFRAQDTSIRPGSIPRTLVTTGPYSWTRNPMYLAGCPILLGVGLLLGPATPLLVLPPWIWIADRLFLPGEERVLEERFGDAYRAYRRGVRRWI